MTTITVVGGDEREWHMASELSARGHEVRTFGVPQPAGYDDPSLVVATTPNHAMARTRWILLPGPGLGAGDVIYAPSLPEPFALSTDLLATTEVAEGGILLGRATPSFRAMSDPLGIRLFEMKDDPGITWGLAAPVAEGVLAVVMEHTDLAFPSLRHLVLGTGRTATRITQLLSACRVPLVVAGRDPDSLARVAGPGISSIDFDSRFEAFADADVIINTVPDQSSVPESHFDLLRGRLTVDIASPPGGLDHAAAQAAGLNVVWARGLSGARAAREAGRIQLAWALRHVH